ncbi:MAG: helix-turn-helix domain-containing protein [Burkholderiaceae bacterium]
MAASTMLDLLRLFTAESPAWKVDRIARALHVSAATAYRYVAHLQRAGLVDGSAGGYYTLGPAVIEFERLIRLGDPVLKAAAPRMLQLRRSLGRSCTVQLWRCYRDCVVLVHSESPRSRGDEKRGSVVSLFEGAPSQAILAALPIHVLRRLFRKRAAEIARSKLGRTWREFCLRLRDIDATGWCDARSRSAAGVAIAAAIHVDGAVLGSLSVEVAARKSRRSIEAIGSKVSMTARRVARVVSNRS